MPANIHSVNALSAYSTRTALHPAIESGLRFVSQQHRKHGDQRPCDPYPTETPPPGVSVTARELDALRLVVYGGPNRAATKTLFVSEITVRTHLVHLSKKLGADSRTHAVATTRSTDRLC